MGEDSTCIGSQGGGKLQRRKLKRFTNDCTAPHRPRVGASPTPTIYGLGRPLERRGRTDLAVVLTTCVRGSGPAPAPPQGGAGRTKYWKSPLPPPPPNRPRPPN